MSNIWTFFTTVLFLYFLSCKGQEMTISPTTVENGGSVTFTCRPPLNRTLNVSGVQIKNGKGQLIADEFENVTANATLRYKPFEGRSEVSGNFVIGASALTYIRLVLHNVTCTDAQTYVCEIETEGNDSKPFDLKHEASLHVFSNLSDITTVIKPRSYVFRVGENITFRCTVPVWNIHTHIVWAWQVKRDSRWVPYRSNLQVYTDRLDAKSRCDDVRETTLNHIITPENKDYRYRCIINNTERFSATFNMSIVHAVPAVNQKFLNFFKITDKELVKYLSALLAFLTLVLVLEVLIFWGYVKKTKKGDIEVVQYSTVKKKHHKRHH